ncbi:nucleoside triphosphate pyrophosphohydrolase [Chlamydiota bacterium]
MKRKSSSVEKVLDLVRILRSDNGCAWDKKQDHTSLKPYLLEEVYEVIDALDKKDHKKLKEELGDLFFQILFHAEIADENNEFNFGDILDVLHKKMLRRHPHVFGQKKVHNVALLIKQWQDIKHKEKRYGSLLDSVPDCLPSLFFAHKIQEKAASIGFDWNTLTGVFEKVTEEIKELEKEIKRGKPTMKDSISEEIGDLLFSLVNLTRHLNLNAELVLHTSIKKFMKRFCFVEKKAKESGKDIRGYSLEELDEWWEESKGER